MTARNVLWIMCDQLRFDDLSCTGHRRLATPSIERLAARGVRFSRACVQSPVCGPSRMSFYTGRYLRSPGANWNRFPLRVDGPTLGDALKTPGVHVSPCDVEPVERDDGLHPTASGGGRTRYDEHLRARGYDGPNPWEERANAGERADGDLASVCQRQHDIR